MGLLNSCKENKKYSEKRQGTFIILENAINLAVTLSESKDAGDKKMSEKNKLIEKMTVPVKPMTFRV